MSDSAMSVNSNVTIKCLDKYGKITRTLSIHNKANIHMVEGLLRYLLGDLTPSSYNRNAYTPEEAIDYIPSELRFGIVGIKLGDRDTDFPKLIRIDTDEIKRPSFDEVKLQEEIKLNETRWAISNNVRFESADITTFDDPNNSLGLLLRVFIPAGQLVCAKEDTEEGTEVIYFIDKNVNESGKLSQGWVYYNPKRKTDNGTGEYETTFTEIGLYSGTGSMLARVSFDGKPLLDNEGHIQFDSSGEIIYEDNAYQNNPITQTATSSLVVEWRIGIVSIGQNDEIISGSDLRNLGIDISGDYPDPDLITFRGIPKNYIREDGGVTPEGVKTYLVSIPRSAITDADYWHSV